MDNYKDIENLTPLTPLANQSQSKIYSWTGIGDAKITYTAFGRAKVRVNLEEGKYRRKWLLAALAAAAIIAAVWLWWDASHQTDLLQSAATHFPIRVGGQVSTHVFKSENIHPVDTAPSDISKPSEPPQTESSNLMTARESAAQPPPGLKAAEQMAAMPVAAQPLTESKPQKAALTTNNKPSKNQTDMQRLPKLSDPLHPVAPATAAQLVSQTTANRPAAHTTPVEPMVKEDAPAPSLAGDNQPTVPVNAQP